MSDTGKGSPDDLSDDLEQIELTIERLLTFTGRYEKRERARLDDVISGSSRIALIQLLEEAKGRLPPGAVWKAVDERLIDREAGSPDFRPRVSDELDLLHLVIDELQRLLSARTPPPGARAAEVPPHLNPLPVSWDKDPAGDEPHRLRRVPPLPTMQQEMAHRHAGFFSEA